MIKAWQKCSKCGSEQVNTAMVEFSNGTTHKRVSCARCENHLGYMPHIDTKHFKMPFGKYKGKTILEISLDDPDYLIWAEKTLNGSVQRRITEFLDAKPGTVA